MPITNFPQGVSVEGKTVKFLTGTVTDATLTIATGLTTVVGCVVTINEDPGASAGDVFLATAVPSSGDVVVSIFQDDGTAATEDTSVSVIAWGT